MREEIQLNTDRIFSYFLFFLQMSLASYAVRVTSAHSYSLSPLTPLLPFLDIVTCEILSQARYFSFIMSFNSYDTIIMTNVQGRNLGPQG